MRVRRAVDEQCVGCGKRIPWWWFSAGDVQGSWHWWCIIKDSWRIRNG